MNGKRVLKTNRKAPVALVAILVLLCCAVAGTLAYLVTSTGPVTNTFTPASVTTEVEEEFNGTTRSNVRIKNTGNIDAYIRTAVIVNWADENGNVYGGAVPKEGKDYSELKLKTSWVKGSDGYYYYTNPVAPEAFTTAMFEPITQQQDCADTNYKLQVTILADGIQSVPADAVKEAWGVTVDSSGQLTAGTSN